MPTRLIPIETLIYRATHCAPRSSLVFDTSTYPIAAKSPPRELRGTPERNQRASRLRLAMKTARLFRRMMAKQYRPQWGAHRNTFHMYVVEEGTWTANRSTVFRHIASLACDLLHRLLKANASAALYRRILEPYHPVACMLTNKMVPQNFTRGPVYIADGTEGRVWEAAPEYLWEGRDIIDGWHYREYRLFRAQIVVGPDDVLENRGDHQMTQTAYDHSFQCDDCGHIGAEDRANYSESDDCTYCNSCYESRRGRMDENEDGSLADYSSQVSKRHWFKRVPSERKAKRIPYLGVELEVYARGVENDTIGMGALVESINDATGGLVICKKDGSLDNYCGFEICSIPATLKFHQQVLWRKFFEGPARHLRGWKREECGIHIHISRDAFADSFHTGRFIRFITSKQNYEFVRKIAGRDFLDNHYCANRPGKMAQAIKGAGDGGRYSAVNIYSSQPTLEVRIFQSNVAPLGFFKNLEFVHAVYVFTAGASISDRALSPDEFCRFVKANQDTYRALAGWLQRAAYIGGGLKAHGSQLTQRVYAPAAFNAIINQ